MLEAAWVALELREAQLLQEMLQEAWVALQRRLR
jgi:hypothetical protein